VNPILDKWMVRSMENMGSQFRFFFVGERLPFCASLNRGFYLTQYHDYSIVQLLDEAYPGPIILQAPLNLSIRLFINL
jgi:hypothetical protein